MTEDELATEFVVDGGGAQLCVATCAACDATVFPRQLSCPRCLAQDMRPALLAGPAELWSWTVQRFAPKTPYVGPAGEDFRPYGVGYVQFGDRVIVEGRLIGAVDEFRIGQTVDVVVERIPTVTGAPYETFAFTAREG